MVVGTAFSENGGITPLCSLRRSDASTTTIVFSLLRWKMRKKIFEEMVVVGTSGSGIEMGLEAAYRALSEPLISNENSGFLAIMPISL